MGQRISNNFNKRFKGRIHVIYAQNSSPLERQLRNERLCEAMTKVISGILGREPTQRELLGIEDLSKAKRKK